MKISYGTMRLIYEDALWFVGKIILLYVTLPLITAWIILGLYVDLPGADVVSAISGPVYFFIPYLAVAGFQTLFPVAIGMGSTRSQFLKSYYSVGTAAIVALIFLLNVGQYLLVKLSHIILHPALFLMEEYHFISFFWIDLIFALFLFGFPFLLYCLWYRLGTSRSILSLTGITIMGMFLYYGWLRNLAIGWEWLADINGILIAIVLSIFGLAVLLSTYPLMQHAPLNPKSPGR